MQSLTSSISRPFSHPVSMSYAQCSGLPEPDSAATSWSPQGTPVPHYSPETGKRAACG